MRLQHFVQLQAIDQQLAGLVHERDDLIAQLAERAALDALREERRVLASTLKGERGHSSDLQWELEDVELRVRTLEDQDREGPTDPLVARELAMLRDRRTQLEEYALAQLERIAELEQQLKQTEQEVQQATAAWAVREPQLHAQLERIGQQLEALQSQRQGVELQLPPGALMLYEDLQRRHRGTALAVIRHRQCSVCRARLPAAVFDMLNTPDPLVRCPRCGRVLFLPDEPA
jgi:uncharacterized protein